MTTSLPVSTELSPPRFSPERAAAILAERYGLRGLLTPLPSERDQNILFTTDDGERFVLKISDAAEDPAFVDCQAAMFRRLEAAHTRFAFPTLVLDRQERAVSGVRGNDGAAHLVRLFRYVTGIPLASARYKSSDLLAQVGELAGTISSALDGFAHAAARRSLRWDLRVGPQVISQCENSIPDAAHRQLLDRFAAAFSVYGTPLLGELRTSVIHNDANDFNVLVSPSDIGDPLIPRAVRGMVDFGDVVHSYTVGEVAVAAAYAMLHMRDPLAAAAHVVRGYHSVFPLDESEMATVYPLACLRLCMSVALSAHQRAQQPENDYLSISESAVWVLLKQLEPIHPNLAHYRMRDACGLDPCPASSRVIKWLADGADRIGPVLDPDPARSSRLSFDMSVGSLEWSTLRGSDDAEDWTEAIGARLRATGAVLGVGRYDEARFCYTAPQFRSPSESGDSLRTVHLGVDLFAPAGTPVLAPLGAVVATVADNRGHLDYGPTVILRHELGGGASFYTLYGHLDPDALERWAPGQAIERGEVVGRIGASRDNGGWAPHLHLQIIADTLGTSGDFPGVAPANERVVWLSISPDPNLILRFEEGCRGTAGLSPSELRAGRRESIGPSLSLAYRAPINVIRGWMQYLYDAEGRRYLDGVNNVAHVGHCHPRVVASISRQSAVLNTNTRYLHENIVRYAERLTGRLPSPLRVCFFVSSGSEANELALRLARRHTGKRDVLVIDHAYHGNTSSLVELSPYKFNGPGGDGAPAHVHPVALPDPYRSRSRAGAGRGSYRDVRGTLIEVERVGRRVGAFFAEAIVSGGGHIELPAGYLADAYREVRDRGGVCIADEVQIGFGRLGTHFWGFETQGVVPDIVTLGKPIGNGHPLGAVVTTPEIAASFDNGMEYFSTFGGNPVSCAVGLAVLDVLEDEELQRRALEVGEHLKGGLRGLMDRHELIGDVRGRGLFIGIELVRDRTTLDPAPRHAAYVVERMKEQGILVSTEGPFHTVIKMKPPLVFSVHDADRVIEAFDELIGDCEGPDSGAVSRVYPGLERLPP
jgi:4-aminobutyrate aminotransferase-like enzyme/Ser/Thr protein kinase RdoA (MazF antagonist)